MCINQTSRHMQGLILTEPFDYCCRWRPRGQQNPSVQNQNLNQNLNQQPHQQRQQTSRTSSGTAHGKQNSADAGLVAVPRILHTSVESGARDGSSYGPPPDQHVPVRGFNSLEVRDMLKKGAIMAAGKLYVSILTEHASIRQCGDGSWEAGQVQTFGRAGE